MSTTIRWMPVFLGLVLICVAVTAQPPTGLPPGNSRAETAGSRTIPTPNFPRESVREATREIKVPATAELTSGKVQLVSQLVEGAQQVVVLDNQNHAMAVYRVDPKTGEISLQSVRRVEWDLKMDQFNGSAPSPEDIKSLLMPGSR